MGFYGMWKRTLCVKWKLKSSKGGTLSLRTHYRKKNFRSKSKNLKLEKTKKNCESFTHAKVVSHNKVH